jgi:hypothetical protein
VRISGSSYLVSPVYLQSIP